MTLEASDVLVEVTYQKQTISMALVMSIRIPFWIEQYTPWLAVRGLTDGQILLDSIVSRLIVKAFVIPARY